MIGESAAVEAMRAGAQDYIMKGQFARLAPAIGRELRDALSIDKVNAPPAEPGGRI
jgi:FixJ family two-component response regulator